MSTDHDARTQQQLNERIPMTTIFHARDFGTSTDPQFDNTLPVFLALMACREISGPSILAFDPGQYHFWPENACEQQLWISNNDSGLRRMIFPLTGMANFAIEGNGAEFMMHGAVSTFVIDHSSNVLLRNFTIDWNISPTVTGQIQSTNGNTTVIKTDPLCWYRIEAGQLKVLTDGDETNAAGFIELGETTLAPAYQSGDVWGDHTSPWMNSFAEIEPGVISFRAPEHRTLIAGNHIVFLRGDRNNPSIFVSESQDVTIENVTVFRAPAMAFIAQRTENIHLDRFNVMFKPGRTQIVTATADATHCVGCRGEITIKNCVFEGQLDDSGNVHGTYVLTVERLSDTQLLMARVHPQQIGVPFGGRGDALEFSEQHTMESVAHATIESVTELNGNHFIATFSSSLDASITSGTVAENMSWIPNLTISGCTARRNRARGFLISTAGKVLVENNTLSPGGTGVLIPGECSGWFESGAVRDVTIRNNHFIDCNTSAWGRACIDVTPEIPGLASRKSPFHRNVVIENNTFETFDMGIVALWSTDGATIRNNKIIRTTRFVPFGKQTEPFDLQNSQNVVLENNEFVVS